MPNEKSIEMRLPSLDELFSSQEERDDAKLKRIYEIPLEEIDPFPDHPFRVQDDEDMMNLSESIRTNGVLTPATVRKKEDGRYEMLSGHRRYRACQLAGLDTLRCEVVDMNRDEATIFMVESNFQRTKILPSEKAYAYKLKLEAMSRQGYRSDLTSNQVGRRLETADIIAEQSDESKTQIRRYIRLTKLIPDILKMVDEQRIAFSVGVELSYLTEYEQQDLLEAIELEDKTPSLSQAIQMKKLSQAGNLDSDTISKIISEEKPNQREKISFQLDELSKYFPKKFTPQDIYKRLLKLAQDDYRRRQRNREER